jgi:hypothetical protein
MVLKFYWRTGYLKTFGRQGSQIKPRQIFFPWGLLKESVYTNMPRATNYLREDIRYISVAQPFYTRGTLNIVEESWRHTNPILHIAGGGGGNGFWH